MDEKELREKAIRKKEERREKVGPDVSKKHRKFVFSVA